MMLCGCCCCWCWNVGMFSMNKTPLMTKLADNIIYINWCVVQNRKIPNRLTCQGRLVNLLKLIIHTILKSVTLRHQTTRSRALALHITFDLLCVFFDLYKLAFGSNIKGILCVVYLLDARHYWIVQGCFSVVVLFVCEVFFFITPWNMFDGKWSNCVEKHNDLITADFCGMVDTTRWQEAKKSVYFDAANKETTVYLCTTFLCMLCGMFVQTLFLSLLLSLRCDFDSSCDSSLR